MPIARVERDLRTAESSGGAMKLPRKSQRFLGGAWIDRQKFSNLGKISETRIERPEHVQVAGDFEKRVALAQDRLGLGEDFRRRENGGRKMELPALDRIVFTKGTRIGPRSVGKRQTFYPREPMPRRFVRYLKDRGTQPGGTLRRTSGL